MAQPPVGESRLSSTWFRHVATLAFAALSLAGCGDSVWGGLAEGLRRPLPPFEIEPSGPALRLSANGRSRGTAELLQESGVRRLWRTGGGVVVATEGARIVATSGLAQVLVATRFDGPDPLANPDALLDRPAVSRRLVDFMRASRSPGDMRFGVSVECRLTARSLPEEDALLIEERCRPKGYESFLNRFWVDAASQAVFRSEQWVGPDVPSLVVEPLAPETAAVGGDVGMGGGDAAGLPPVAAPR